MDLSKNILDSLIRSDFIDLNTVITQPDKKVGRKKEITPPPVKICAQESEISILQPNKIKDKNVFERLKELNPELIVVAAYGQILPKEIIELPKYGCINVHASLLPKYRGASPIQTAILNGDAKTGITIMKMDEGMDTGDIIAQDEIKIEDNDDAQTLHDKLSKLGADLLIQTLPDYLAGKIKSTPQDDSKATHTKILTRDDGEIDFSKTAKEIERQLRAFTPWPGIFTHFQVKKIKIFKLKTDEEINPLFPPGKIYEAEGTVVINCRDSSIILEEVQVEGKRVMSAKEFINGYLK